MIKRSMRWVLAAGVLMSAAPFALAQASGTTKSDAGAKEPQPVAQPAQSPRKIKSVRRSVVDLEQQARERRPGQVMPGDPAPVGRAPTPSPVPNAMEGAMEASSLPKPDAATPEKGASIALPDTAPANRAVVKPSVESSGRTNSIAPAPAPAPAAEPVPRAMEGAMEASSLPKPDAPAVAPSAAVATATPAPAPASASAKAPTAAHAEPLPAMEEGKPEPVAEKAHPADTGVALVDKSIIPNIPMALSTGPAKLRIESLSGDASGVQWRVPGEAWRTPGAAETAESKIEVRAGLDSDLVLVVDERVQLRVSRLGRALIERSEETGGTTAVSITLSRGAVEVRPLKEGILTPGEMFARIRTPDQMFGVTGALRVEYDAFTGTRRRTINP